MGKGRERKLGKKKTVMIFVGQYTNMTNRKKPKRATTKQNVWVEEVEKVWSIPISQEGKGWTTRCLEAKLRKDHDGRLTQDAAVELAKRDRRVERYVDDNKL